MDCLKPYQKLGIDFLYRTYKKNLHGAILNEENDMNMHLQVGTFLNLLYNRENVLDKFFILILCRDNFIFNWHYHLINDCKFTNVKILNEDNFIDENDTISPSIHLLSFSLLKLCNELQHFHYFTVCIDNFDEIALKRNYRKLSGDFHVGLTDMNFYMNDINLKLQWNMLNWINPGCVGKYNDFSKVYNENVIHFPLFWYRITWNYCDSFKKLTENEKNNYDNQIIKWSNKCGFDKMPSKKQLKRNNDGVEDNKKPKIDYKPLPTMDESPILTSIIKNLNTIPDPERTCKDNNNKLTTTIFPSTSKSTNNEDDFLKSFILNDCTTNPSKTERFSNDDIELLLQNTDKLLNG